MKTGLNDMKTGISFIFTALLEDFQEDNAENAVKNGFLGATGVSVQYKIAHFDFFTGKISASTAGTTIITDVDFSLSNISNNIQISYNRTSTNYGILLYR